MKKTFVFDMDGVLIDSERLILECILDAADETADRAELRAALFESLGVTNPELHRIIRAHMGPDFSFDACEKRAETLYFKRIARDGVPVKPGAREFLSYLDENGFRIGLASSSPKKLVEKELGMAGLLPYFQVLVTGDMVENSKPAPDIYLLACRQLGVKPENAFAIEDSPNGIRSAAAAGLTVLGVPDLAPIEGPLSALCHAVYTSLLDILDWVTSCASKESD